MSTARAGLVASLVFDPGRRGDIQWLRASARCSTGGVDEVVEVVERWFAGERAHVERWREVGGPPVGPPQRRGFGTALLNMAITGAPDSPSPVRFEPQGLVYEIDVPLASVT